METKKFILFFASMLALLSLINCKNNKLEGTYYYVRSESKDIFQIGRNIACSSIDKFEFKNGKCYLNIMGVERRLDYEVDNGKIYFENNKDIGDIGLTIVDENTLQFAGCLFQKQNNSTTTDKIEISENKNSGLKSEKKAVTIKEDSKDRKVSQLISPKSVVRNNQTDERIKGVIEKNSKDYTITKTDEAVIVFSKSENTEYLFIPYTESVEGFTFYSDKNINEIKNELKQFGFSFINDSSGYIDENGLSCYSVQLEKTNGKTKITYGYECD